MPGLRDATIEALEQMLALIAALQIAARPAENLYGNSGIGKHVRHVVDHFRAFASGFEHGLIDYDVRDRESAIEYCADTGRAEIQKLILWLQTITPSDSFVAIQSEISVLKKENRCFDSTVNRELFYLINHTIHHTAYAALIARQHSIIPSVLIGLAPSTAQYLRHGRSDRQ